MSPSPNTWARVSAKACVWGPTLPFQIPRADAIDVLHACVTADNYMQKRKVLPMTWDKDDWPQVNARGLNRYQSRQ